MASHEPNIELPFLNEKPLNKKVSNFKKAGFHSPKLQRHAGDLTRGGSGGKQVNFTELQQRDYEECSQEYDGKAHCKFHVGREIVIWLLVIFYAADICLDYWVCVSYFNARKPMAAWFIFFCILIPNLYAGYKSMQWYLLAHANEPIRNHYIWIVRIFFFPISPLLRYFDAWKNGRRSRAAYRDGNYKEENKFFEDYLVDSAEVAMLRLFIIFLEDAPIAVVNLSELILTPPSEWTISPWEVPDPESMKLGVVCAKLLFTMSLGVVHYISINKMAWHAAQSRGLSTPRPTGSSQRQDWEKKGMLTWYAELTIYWWQLLSIASRLMAYSLFTVAYFPFLWLPVMIRWVLNSTWIYFDVKEMSLINSIAFGGVYLFSFVTTSPGQQILRISLYYFVTLCEDAIIAILWSAGMPYNEFSNIAMGIMFGCSSGGICFLVLYYTCFHPDKHNIWLRTWLRERKKG